MFSDVALLLGRRDEKSLSRLAFGEGRSDENSWEANTPPQIPFVITAITAERLGFANIFKRCRRRQGSIAKTDGDSKIPCRTV